jgi:tetratricopeptide (TPR) repeat protein
MDFKRIIDDNRTEITRFVMIYAIVFGVFLVIHSFTGEVPLLFLTVVPLVMTIIAMFILTKLGNAFGKAFYGGRRARWSIDEIMGGELDQIRFSKRNEHYEEALQNTNELLKKNPDYPEALFLKAQILHEAYGYNESARKCLQKILDTVPGDKEVHSWASDYLEKISLIENERKREDKRNGGNGNSS